jgi:hypothetical protein
LADDRRAELQVSPEVTQFTSTPFVLPLLPRRYQSHCDYVKGHFVCAGHCGTEYQFYYCSPSATGCCHVGLGYCDSDGKVKCAPTWYRFPFPSGD